MSRLKSISGFLLTLFLLACTPAQPPETHGLLYEQAKPINAFVLEDQTGNTVTEQDLRGNWTLLFLGYTHCPDICQCHWANIRAMSVT